MKPTIKLVNGLGRTVCVFAWDGGGEGRNDIVIPGAFPPAPPQSVPPQWRVTNKPESRKSQRRSDSQLAEQGFDIPPGGLRPDMWQGGRPVRLEVPGLTLRWEKVVAVLDRLAEQFAGQDDLTLTVDQFRRCVT